MKNGYKISWTEHALEELSNTFGYLGRNFSDKEFIKLANKIETVLELISQNPDLFPKSTKESIYRVVLLKYNTLYYRVVGKEVQKLSFFSNRQNPSKREL